MTKQVGKDWVWTVSDWIYPVKELSITLLALVLAFKILTTGVIL